MHKKILMVLLGLSLLVSFSVVPETRGERATQEEMEQVCQNWLSYMVYQKGAWAGETRPQIVNMDEIVDGDTVLARCFSIAPSGFVVVPILKELPPIMAYSEKYGLDINEREGFPQLLREVLLDRTRRYAKIYGSLDAVQPATGEVLLGRGHKAEWNRFLKSEEEFKTDLIQGKFQPLTEAGPLLTTSWHQRAPYNNFCPVGDQECDVCPSGKPPSFPTLVGCVATAAAQIMRYWNWPPSGTGNYSYYWNGDQSCGGSTPAQVLSATFSDPYDWQNMPDHCESGCSPEEEDALAELCYEVGVAFVMDYGVCGSGTYTGYALTVFPTWFRYDSSIEEQDRDDHTPAEWFSIIRTEIDSGRPMQYRISQHSIVCDGWRDTGGQNQFHMNYGWSGSFTTWYAIDSLYCRWEPDSLCPPMEEFLIKNIMPVLGSEIVVKPDGTGDYPTIQAAINAASSGDTILLMNGTFTGDGNRDIDFSGKAITVRSYSGNPGLCVIDCEASFEGPHRGFYFHYGEGSGSVIEGVTIKNGYVHVYPQGGGGVFCDSGSSPTIRNCLFSNNGAMLYGGGMACRNQSHPTLENCTFFGNSTGGLFYDFADSIFSANLAGPDTEMAFGGGMYCDLYSIPTLTNCVFLQNSSEGYGGGMSCNGGASPALYKCVFTNNSANFYGGGMSCCDDSSHPILVNCIFAGNSANSYGGGMGVSDGQATLINCTFSYNSSPVGGGGMYCMSSGSAMLENTILAFSPQGEAVGCNVGGSVTLTCCDVYGNAGGDWVGCIEDQYGVNGNFSLDPLFCDPDNEDYHLLDDSPCASAQNPECDLIGVLNTGCDQAPQITMPITETGIDIPFVYGSDTLVILNFASEELKYVTVEREKGSPPPDLPEGTSWVHRYYSITPISEGASFEATMTLFYSQSEFDVSGLSDESNLGLCRYEDSDSTWTFEDGIVDTEENSITLSGVTDFSVWGITDSNNTSPMIRGDANRSGSVDLADAVFIVNWLFIGGPAPNPLWVGDANCSGGVDLADAVYLVNWLFIGGPPPGCK